MYVQAAGADLTWHNLFNTVEGILALATIALVVVTGGLASATYWMARRTASLAESTRDEVAAIAEQIELDRQTVLTLQEQVEVGREEVEVSRRAVESTIRPVLVDLPRPLTPETVGGGMREEQHEVAWEGASERKRMPGADAYVWADANGIYVSVPLRNVGPGSAFIRGIGLVWQRPVPGGGTPTIGVVPPGEATRVQFRIPVYEGSDAPTLDEFQSYATFTLDVAYTDVAGAQWTLTKAHVSRDGYGRWVTRQIMIHHKQGEHDGSIDWGETVAASGPSWGL